MPADLIAAHDALDKTVDRVIGFTKRPTEEQRQERLFAHYVEMNEQDRLLTSPKKPNRRGGKTT